MTKTEKTQEVTRLFYEFCEQKGYIAEDDGFGAWVVAKFPAGLNQMLQVDRRGFAVHTNGCECGKTLKFAKELEIEIENYKRMFEL